MRSDDPDEAYEEGKRSAWRFMLGSCMAELGVAERQRRLFAAVRAVLDRVIDETGSGVVMYVVRSDMEELEAAYRALNPEEGAGR